MTKKTKRLEEVATILLADRYIFLSYGKAEISPSPMILDYDPDKAEVYDYDADKSRESLLENLDLALDRAATVCPNLRAVVIGCCVQLNMSATFDRREEKPKGHDYGVIGQSSSHSNWAEVNLYEIACEKLPNLNPDKIYVRADTSLAALGEYFYRVHQTVPNLAPDHHWNNPKLKKKYTHNKHVTLAYIKLSAEINGGFVYNGNLLGGMNHPFLGAMKPQLMTVGRHTDEFAGCGSDGQSYSGLMSARALQERLTEIGDKSKLIYLDEAHEIWEILAYYASQLCIDIMAMHVPTVIVFGGHLVRDYRNSSWPKNRIVSKISERVSEHVENGPVKFPHIVEDFPFIQKSICPTPVAYGGLVLGAKKLHEADFHTYGGDG